MESESVYHIAFLVLFLMLLAMRIYFMVKVRRSGGRIMPDEGAIKREGGCGWDRLRNGLRSSVNILRDEIIHAVVIEGDH